MADDAGSEPAGSSEDALSESCASSETTGTHSGVEDLPSSPPSGPSFDAAQDLLLSDKSEKVDLDETTRTEESSEFNHDEKEEDNEEESDDEIEKNVLDINRFNHQPEDRLSSPVQSSDSSSSDSSFDSTLDSSRSELSAEVPQISNDSLFQRSQEKPDTEGGFSVPLIEEDSSKEDSFIIPQSEEEFSSPPRKEEDNAEEGNLLLSEDEEEPKKEFDFTAPSNCEESKNGDNYLFPQNEKEFVKEDNFTTPQSEEKSNAEGDPKTPLNDEEPMEEDTPAILPREEEANKEDNLTTSPNNEELMKEEDNVVIPDSEKECKEENNFSVPENENEFKGEDNFSVSENENEFKGEDNFSVPENENEFKGEDNFSIPGIDKEAKEKDNFSISLNDKDCKEEKNFSIPESEKESKEDDNLIIPRNDNDSKVEYNSATLLNVKELEKQVYFALPQNEEKSKEENVSILQNKEGSKEEDTVIVPLDDKREENFAIPVNDKQGKKEDIDKSPRVEKPPQILKRILYSGYKKKGTTCRVLKPERRISNRGNPFNPSWKKNSKASPVDSQNRHLIDLTDSPDSNYQDCTHYLGLQPSINFRCNHCGMSGFESIQLLNLHQGECRKVLGHSTSTNIKITRKVYLCSACGTYYESWHLFYHMRKVHDKFMCLYCLGMFTYSEKLCEHLTTKHQVNFINFPDIESFKKCNLSSYLFLCLECDNVMSDSENFKHSCTPQKVVPKIVLKQPVQNPSVPCVVVEPSPKKIQDSPKNNLTVDSPATDPSTFCHVDIQSPIKDSPAPPVVREPSPSPPPSPPPPAPPVREKEPTKVNSIFLSEFPRIDLQSSKSRDRDRDTSDRGSERISDYEGGFDSGDEIRNNSDTPKMEIRSENKSVKVKRVKRQRAGTGRQSKRPKLDPEKQRCALEKLTETIDAVAKNYTREPSLPPAPTPPPVENTEDPVKSIDPPITNHEPPLMENNVAEEAMEEEPTKQVSETPNEETAVNGLPDKPPIWKSVPDKNLGKFKLRTDLESDEESDDSNKLSMVIDETPAHSDNDSRAAKISTKEVVNTSDDSNQEKEPLYENAVPVPEEQQLVFKPKDEIALAGEDVPAMALTLDDKVQDVKVQHILKECVRTSCMSCNYCRRAIKIAVNGKFLALHLLSEHRYTPTKNDSPEDVINKLKSSLDELSDVYFNTESYDSSDPSIHVPYDKDSTFDCFQCSFVTHTHKDLHIHKRKSHTKSLLLCIMCKINFYSYSELLCHLCPGHYNPDYQFNNIDVTFRCCFCKLDTIPSAFRLMVHLRKCHHTCDICLEICSDQQKLSTHMWKHKLNHLCYRCGIAYASKLDITKHLFWKHGTESVLCKKCLQKKWPHVYHFCIPPTSFLCEECNSCFSKAVALKVHKRIHAGDFSYQCTQCEKKFVSKKLLQKHEDHHNNPVDLNEQDEKGKEEIIDVTGESTGNTDGTGAGDNQVEESENQKGSDKENESSKHHKKHKKDKKTKQVVDVYDLPPLNLSSESDSSDDESTKNNANDPDKDLKDSDSKNDDTPEDNNDNKDNTESVDSKEEVKTDTNNIPDPALTNQDASVPPENQEPKDPENPVVPIDTENCNEESTEPSDDKPLESSEQLKKSPDHAVENTSIWENFYKTNSNNKNLPYPLCAMKSEDAYKIIMGDHDYCLQMKMSDPVIKEDILQSNLECDKVDPVNSVNKPDLNETTASDSSPTKKKQKSPKKKSGNNSSSSSDSSSDSDSSSCSCGENCSCSSSSSDSSSSSSSDSDSSASEGGNKQKTDKRKKKKEKKTKNKAVPNVDQNGENKTIVETVTPAVPEEPSVRESDLETEESSTDEEFYDRQPQKQSNQLMAEKRNQLMLLASVAPVHGEGLGHELTKSSTLTEAFSDLSGTAPSTPDPSQQPTKKVSKNRRKKSFMMKSRKRVNKTIPTYTLNNTTQPSDSAHISPKPYILKLKEPKRQETPPTFGSHTPPSFVRNTLPSDNSGGGSESESVRASKRKRVPNKFYGYSSGEEEERMLQAKWRKPEVSTPPPPPPPPPPPVVTTPKFVHSTPQTPRIQLSVPKQIIRKNNTDPTKARHYVSGNDSTDSSSDNDKRFRQQHVPPPPPPQPLPSPPVTKQDKNLYCYCRCPYDEVSEMIACDDENCKIEWFHFECVGISVPPKGQWFCPQCSKKRGILP